MVSGAKAPEAVRRARDATSSPANPPACLLGALFEPVGGKTQYPRKSCLCTSQDEAIESWCGVTALLVWYLLFRHFLSGKPPFSTSSLLTVPLPCISSACADPGTTDDLTLPSIGFCRRPVQLESALLDSWPSYEKSFFHCTPLVSQHRYMPSPLDCELPERTGADDASSGSSTIQPIPPRCPRLPAALR